MVIIQFQLQSCFIQKKIDTVKYLFGVISLITRPFEIYEFTPYFCMHVCLNFYML